MKLFLEALKKERQSLKRKIKVVAELDLSLTETFTYRLELINILIVSMQGFKSAKSLKNLKHRPQF